MFGITVFSAGYVYLDGRLNQITTGETTENIPYYESIPEDTAIVFNICGDSILINLGFSEKRINIIFLGQGEENSSEIFGYDIDYRIYSDYDLVGYLVDAVGGIELEDMRYTGVQITEMLEYSNVRYETKRILTDKIITGIANKGFTKEDMLYITENADTNLKFASAYLWIDYIAEICRFPQFAN